MYKIKAFRQLEHSDCGITCIRIIAYFYGVDIPLKFLRSICDISRVGISIRDILSATKKIGFEANAVKVSAEDILKMPLPAILYWENKHYIVLYKIKNKEIYILVEHQSKVDKRMPRRIFEYCMGIMMELEKMQKELYKSKKNDMMFYNIKVLQCMKNICNILIYGNRRGDSNGSNY